MNLDELKRKIEATKKRIETIAGQGPYTDPMTWQAVRSELVELQEQGVSYAEMYQQIKREQREAVESAERILDK